MVTNAEKIRIYIKDIERSRVLSDKFKGDLIVVLYRTDELGFEAGSTGSRDKIIAFLNEFQTDLQDTMVLSGEFTHTIMAKLNDIGLEAEREGRAKTATKAKEASNGQ